MPSTAAANFRAITQCLKMEQRATLGPGIFQIPHGIKIPSNCTLEGSMPAGSVKGSNMTQASRLILAVPTAITYSLLEVASDSLVTSLILDASNKQRDASCCKSVISFTGNNSVVSDVEVLGSPTGVGVLFESPTSHDNLVLRLHVHHCYYGIVFSAGLRSHQMNVVAQSTIDNIDCDSISFAGFGKVQAAVIRNSGFACGPPSFGAGAGFFCKGNKYGAVVEDSIVSNTCGMSLDVDSCLHMEIRNNSFSNTGYDFDRNLTHCWGMPTAILLDSQMCSVSYNTMENSRSSNRIHWSGDPHQVYSQVAAPLFSDLPQANDTILNFGLLHRPNSLALPSIKNDISNNSFLCRCDEENCTGVAYFAGRGTGLESLRTPGYQWGERLPQQPSEFNGNMVSQDSDVGSVRCGENLYAAAQPVCPEESDWPCNLDDYLHPTQNFRNDDCKDYISPTHTMAVLESGLRNPLPVAPRSDVSMYHRLSAFTWNCCWHVEPVGIYQMQMQVASHEALFVMKLLWLKLFKMFLIEYE